jgi:SAM-dependent methyltransferase
MSQAIQPDQVPRGNTAPGVNRAVIEYLRSIDIDLSDRAVLDVPCGKGEFLKALGNLFPGCKLYGADINDFGGSRLEKFQQIDLSVAALPDVGVKFQLVTAISGVMEFDNTLNFFRSIRSQIADNGLLVVTNDNLLSARDRILYFFTGRFRQYPLLLDENAPTWKILTLDNLVRILRDAGFDAIEIRYVPSKVAEWLWLPLALVIYLFQTISFATTKRSIPYSTKAKRYPFISLLSRHYFVVCKPR